LLSASSPDSAWFAMAPVIFRFLDAAAQKPFCEPLLRPIGERRAAEKAAPLSFFLISRLSAPCGGDFMHFAPFRCSRGRKPTLPFTARSCMLFSPRLHFARQERRPSVMAASATLLFHRLLALPLHDASHRRKPGAFMASMRPLWSFATRAISHRAPAHIPKRKSLFDSFGFDTAKVIPGFCGGQSLHETRRKSGFRWPQV
jgi:hypothetical protein